METELRENAFNDPKPYACWSCGSHISAADNYCRKCGKGQGSFVDWYYKHWGMPVLILAAGPFALWFVWRSPVLSRNAKWIYAGLISLFTWYLASATWQFFSLLQAALGGLQMQSL